MTQSLISYLQKKPLVAILRGVQSNEIISIARVLVDSGFSIIEVPLNSPDPLASITNLSNEFGEKILIGAGTVLQKTDVLDIKNAGAKLAVAPNANPEVITAAKDGGNCWNMDGFISNLSNCLIWNDRKSPGLVRGSVYRMPCTA